MTGELRVVLAQLVRRLREQARGSDLTKSQSAVLSRLEREGASTTTELARAEGIRQQSMAAIVAACGISTHGILFARETHPTASQQDPPPNRLRFTSSSDHEPSQTLTNRPLRSSE